MIAVVIVLIIAGIFFLWFKYLERLK